jgi:hypothetical protein
MGKSRKARERAMEAAGKQAVPAKQEAAPANAPAGDGRNEQKISMVAHGAGGIAAGAGSFYAGTMFAFPIGIILLFVIVGVYMKMTGRHKLGAWAASGIFIYLFMWLDAWLFLSNFLI